MATSEVCDLKRLKFRKEYFENGVVRVQNQPLTIFRDLYFMKTVGNLGL